MFCWISYSTPSVVLFVVMAAAAAGAGTAAPVSHAEIEQSLSLINRWLDSKKYDVARNALTRLNLPETDGRRRTIEALLCICDGKYEEGLEHALYAVHLQAGHWQAYTIAARAYVTFGQFQRALDVLTKLNTDSSASEGDVAHGNNTKARLRFFQRQSTELTKWIGDIEQKFKGATERKGIVGQYQLKELIKLCPLAETFAAAELEGMISGKEYAAVAAKAVTLHPLIRQHPDVRAHIGTAYLYTGRMTDARAEFDEAAPHSKRAGWYADLFSRMDQSLVAIRGLLAAQKYTEASAAGADALRLDLKANEFNSEVKCLMSDALLGTGDADAALRKSNEAHQLNPKNLNALRQMARIHLTEGRHAECSRVIESILNIAADDPVALGMRREVDVYYELTHATHYEVLRVAPTATQDEIKSAYRKRMTECHPDLAPAEEKSVATTRAARCNAAYAELSDAVLRDEYDRKHAYDMAVDSFLNANAGGAAAAATDRLRSTVASACAAATDRVLSASKEAANSATAAALSELDTSSMPMLDDGDILDRLNRFINS